MDEPPIVREALVEELQVVPLEPGEHRTLDVLKPPEGREDLVRGLVGTCFSRSSSVRRIFPRTQRTLIPPGHSVRISRRRTRSLRNKPHREIMWRASWR